MIPNDIVCRMKYFTSALSVSLRTTSNITAVAKVIRELYVIKGAHYLLSCAATMSSAIRAAAESEYLLAADDGVGIQLPRREVIQVESVEAIAAIVRKDWNRAILSLRRMSVFRLCFLVERDFPTVELRALSVVGRARL